VETTGATPVHDAKAMEVEESGKDITAKGSSIEPL
jgi:hypothetical protein